MQDLWHGDLNILMEGHSGCFQLLKIQDVPEADHSSFFLN